MSWAIKPKSFYADQLRKLEIRAKEGKETSPKLVEKYYKGYLSHDGRVVNPILGLVEDTMLNKPKLVWTLKKPPRETKPCKHCGELIEKPLREGRQSWEQRKFCSMTCKKLNHETMPNLSKSDKI